MPTCDTVARTNRKFEGAIDNMKKTQAAKFWKEISGSTSAKEVISAFANKRGYGGKRTLVRYSQAATGFREGLPSTAIAEKTGWGAGYIDKIHAWWREAIPNELGPVKQELAIRVPPARIDQETAKEVISAQIASKILELLESRLSKPIQGAITENTSRSIQTDPYDLKRVAASRKYALAEIIRETLADLGPNEIYSVIGIQARILKSTPEQRIEFLRERLTSLNLTPAEETTLAGTLIDSGLVEKLQNYAEALYLRLKALERHHYPLTTSDVMLISRAAKMDDDQFNEVIKEPPYNEEPDYNADVISAATKLLVGVGDQVVLMDEIEKDTRMGLTRQAATSAAQGRLELARRLAASWLPYCIETFLRTLANRMKPSIGWVQANQ
jgi:hypothetical protein